MSEQPNFLDEARLRFEESRSLISRAVAQLDEEEFVAAPDAESNSVAIIVKHLAGNMRSRWTGFLTSDGEKPDRRRDLEFIRTAGDTRERLLAELERGWELVFATLEQLKAEDLARTVLIRAEPHTVLGAITRQLTHYAYHAGQIVFLSKQLRSKSWETLSVARGKSEHFTAQKVAEFTRRGERGRPD